MVRRDTQARAKDVKVVKGTDVSSDHYLLLLRMSMRLQGAKCWKEGCKCGNPDRSVERERDENKVPSEITRVDE